MACNDRQLTEAQRQAGFQQQRAGVNRAIRPFSGSQTLENLIDYVNRELGPALRATRDACNDVFLQVADNAPSANPLAFYFSTSTAAADPTVGRMRLNQAVQNTATIIRVSENNGRLQSVQPWLDVMSGGPTTPLGTLTMVDAINPSRFLRFDLNTMTDQGAYWDLGVTIIESSDTNPFVEDEPVVVGFIAGVSAAGSTVPVGSLSPVARDTFLGNIGTTTAAPAAVPLANVDSTSVVYDATAHEFQRAALTSEVTAAQNVNALTITRSTGFQTSPWTGIHQFNNELRLGTTHTETATSGALNVTLTAGATRLIINSTGDLDLQTISGAALGRVLVVEHIRTSGTGVLSVQHATTSNAIATPDENPVYLGQRGSMVLCGRGGTPFWDIVAPPKGNIWRQIEHATTTGTINDMVRTNDARYTMLVPSGALTVTGLAAGDAQGDIAGIQRQGSTSTCTLNDNDTGSAATSRFANYQNVDLRLGDDELAMFAYLDITSGGTNDPRWVCFTHRAPFCNTTTNVLNDEVFHDGTDWRARTRLTGAQNSNASVSGSTTPLSVASLTIPANTAAAGTCFEFFCGITATRGATVTPVDMTIRLRINGTTAAFYTTAIIITPALSSDASIHGFFNFTTIGAAGVVRGRMAPQETAPVGATTTQSGIVVTGLDTTASITVEVDCLMSAAVSGVSIVGQGGLVQRRAG